MKYLPNNDELNKIPKFAILQNSKTKQSGIWNGTKWIDASQEDYEMLGLLSQMIRTAPDPVHLMEEIVKENNWS